MKKKLITSALPYVNNVPHLGNIIGSVLSADVYARYCRSKGYETLYICANDEYGTATENKAREEGLTPRQICDKYHQIHKDVYKHFNIQFDYFGRTSTDEHTEITQRIFKGLESEGNIIERAEAQTYCDHDKMFLADRYVEGECPHCGDPDARGDQCDSCGKLLQPTELINPRCQICGNPPSTRKTSHLYINLPKLEDDLSAFHEKAGKEGKWAKNALTTTKSWMAAGLMPRPITRDLSWGVKVPKEGYENKVFYVWFDAPIGYISNTKSALGEDWVKWWQDPENTELYQFMAKDNIPFHTVVFPASLLGSGEPWTMLHHISSTEYLNYENDKFSKSKGIGVFGTDVIETEIPVDLWRFYLLNNRPEKSDTSFSWDAFFEEVNSTLLDNIGNLVNRVAVFTGKQFDGKLYSVEFPDEHSKFLKEAAGYREKILEAFESVQLKEALKQILAAGKSGNKFFQDQTPWASIKEDRDYTMATLNALVLLIRDIGVFLEPFLPSTSEKILNMLNMQGLTVQQLGDLETSLDLQLGEAAILYPKLDKKKVQIFRERYSGKQQKEVKKVDPVEAWKQVSIQVGEVKSVKPHPEADRLFIEEVDLGEGRFRTIVSGLVGHITEEELQGKKVLVAANLEPATIRGVESEGMILAAEKKKKLEVIMVEQGQPGDAVMIADVESSPAEKISIDAFFDTDLRIKDSKMVLGDKEVVLQGQPVLTKTLENAKVK